MHRLRKLFLFPRYQESECLSWLLNSPETAKGAKSLLIKDSLSQAEKGKAFIIIKKSTSTGKKNSKWELVG